MSQRTQIQLPRTTRRKIADIIRKDRFGKIHVGGLGNHNKGYPGAFTIPVEKVILSLIKSPCLHLFSGTSKIGDIRVDLERPEATHNMNVADFIIKDDNKWEWLVLDPPYSKRRKVKEYALFTPFANVPFRQKFIVWLQDHVNNILWLDTCAPKPIGFKREALWFFLPGGYHTIRVLSWLKRESQNIKTWQ